MPEGVVLARRVTRVIAAIVAAAAVVVVPSVDRTAPADAAGTTFYIPADGVLHLSGHGFGHGHGMSQWGAYGGAISGQTYRQILAWYYGNPAFGTAAGPIKVQITVDGAGSGGLYDTEVQPAAGLTATDAAGHTLTVPTKDAKGATYDHWRALLTAAGTFLVQGHTSAGWADVSPAQPAPTPSPTPSASPSATASPIPSPTPAPSPTPVLPWTGWVRWSDTAQVLTLVLPTGHTRRYRETLELDKTSGAHGITVNRLTLEHYLLGVVSSEMPCSWVPTVGGTKRLDALEAQAVAARSYAAWRIANPRSAQVDIVDSTSDQAYVGYSAEQTAISDCPWTNANGSKTSTSAAAIAATTGQILVDSSHRALFAQYSASNGGFEIAGSQPYLPARPDAWDGVPTDSWNSHSWTTTVTAGDLQSAYGGSIGTFTSLTVDSREGLSGEDQSGRTVSEQWGGRIISLTITGTSGNVTVSGASFAGAMGLMSSWFTVVVAKPSVPTSVSAMAGDGQATVSWAPPASDGGGGIRGYTVTASPAIPPVTVAASQRSVTVSGLTDDTSYVLHVAAVNTAGAGATANAPAVTPSAQTVVQPLPATQLLDTRSSGGPIGPRGQRTIVVAGVAGVPSSGAVSVALSVATVGSTAATNVTVWPAGGNRPANPQLYAAKNVPANTLVWTKVGKGGAITVANGAGSTQLHIDVEGYATEPGSSGSVLTPAVPARLLDTRNAGGPLTRGTTRVVTVAGRDGVPSTATAALVRLMVLSPSGNTYLRAWGSGGSAQPPYQLYAATKSYAGTSVIVPLDSTGAISLATTHTTGVVMDLEGWYASAPASPSTGLTVLSSPPRRVLDTRTSLGGHSGGVRAQQVVAATVVGSTLHSPVAGATAVFLTVTAYGPATGSLVVWPAGTSRPGVTTVHVSGRAPTTTTVLVPIGSNGQVAIKNLSSSTASVIVDIAGWTTGSPGS